MYKKILIIALNENWTGISRLPFGLSKAGFLVYALCPRKSFLAKTIFLKKSLLYPTFTYSRSKLIYLWMLFSIILFRPDFIIPGDEDAILALYNLSNMLERIPYLNQISKLIRSSLTAKTFDSTILNKSDFQKKCNEWGLRTPKNRVVKNSESCLSDAAQMGYPVVLKNDSGYGGTGVFICYNEEDIKKQIHLLKNKTMSKKMKDLFKNMFFVSIFNNDNKISLQQYIDGPVGQSPFCAKNGLVFAQNSMLKFKTYPGKTGPTSVAFGIENPELNKFVETMALKLNYTGFGSLEFITDEKTGLLYIIELNPRPTPTCHISGEFITNDLCDTLFKGLNLLPRKISLFKPFLIALFPGEKKRDPKSPYLFEGYHDIPLDDPILLKALDLS